MAESVADAVMASAVFIVLCGVTTAPSLRYAASLNTQEICRLCFDSEFQIVNKLLRCSHNFDSCEIELYEFLFLSRLLAMIFWYIRII